MDAKPAHEGVAAIVAPSLIDGRSWVGSSSVPPLLIHAWLPPSRSRPRPALTPFMEFDGVFIRRRTRGYNYSLYESLRERCDVSVGLGVDIVEIERMRRILDRTPSFAHKVFTDAEQDYCNRKGNPATHYAARFAAKEAVCKALGTGILASGIGMRDVEVVRDSHGKPAIALHGAAAHIAEEQGVVDVPLSITYTHSVAVANVAITKASQAEREKRRDVKAELAQQFKEMRGMLDDLGEQTATSAEAKGAGEPVSE